MLEKIREGSQGFWAKAILGLVIITFALAGVGSYLNTKGDEPVATVNGQEIGYSSFERAYQSERSRMESQYGEQFADLAADAGYLKQFRQSILDRLIADVLLDQAATDLGIRISAEQIKKQIVGMKEFQLDGKFDNERYLMVLRQVGYQPSDFRDYLRGEMTRQQVKQALMGSDFALVNEVEEAYSLQQQTRDIRYFNVAANQFASAVSVSDDEVNNYYQTNIAQYDTEEKVSLAYVELTLDDLLTDIKVTDEEAEAYYQANIGNYGTEGQRKVAHILIEMGEDEDAALASAESVLAKIEAGEDFAALATEFSADTFSAEDGGELDWFVRGDMDPAFEEAAFAMETAGSISPVIKSTFGYHIIKLIEAKKAQTTPFAEVKEDVVKSLKNERGLDKLYALHQRMSEVAFEVPDSLVEVADIAGKSIQQTSLFTSQSAPAPFDAGRLLNVAFSEELIHQGVNSEVIEAGADHIIVFRVNEHEAVRTKSIDEVKDSIMASLSADKQQAAAAQWSNGIVAQLQAGEDVSSLLSEKSIEWQEQAELARFGGNSVAQEVVTESFKLAPAVPKVVELASGNVAVVEVTKVNQAEKIEDNQLTALQTRLASAKSQQTLMGYVASLKANAEIKISTQI
ncbi:SurA N-terminal domain-containing protein [Alteromonadaceae bacterium BrNp21-10]|nr:SurA N-terminal domain-containing protein [Alteromonadaceae bacterium BrNp21-10]